MIKPKKKDADKKTLSFFMVGFPTVLIILIGFFLTDLTRSVIQIALAVYQFILLKQFLDSYYGE